jgi:hypothetical protein
LRACISLEIGRNSDARRLVVCLIEVADIADAEYAAKHPDEPLLQA